MHHHLHDRYSLDVHRMLCGRLRTRPEKLELMKKTLMLLTLIWAFPVLSHGGQLDSYGCYTNRATGRYECLRGQHRDDNFFSQGDMLRQMRARDTPRSENSSQVKQLAPVPAMETGVRGRARPAVSYPVAVLEVVDGATIIVLPMSKVLPIAKSPVTVRLYGIDFPDLGQPRGREAADFVRNAVLHKDVEVMAFPLGKDKSGRTVATVVAAGRPLQESLLKAGLAWVSPACVRPECADWKSLEKEAKAAKAGWWKE
jgi:endonuclease YncB( thermonuclease family)